MPTFSVSTRSFARTTAYMALLFALLSVGAMAQSFLGYTRSLNSITFKGPYVSMAVDATGNSLVYDSNLGAPIIYTVAPDGNTHTYLSASDGMVLGALPGQLTIDAGGTLYIPDPSNNRVLVSTSARSFSELPIKSGALLAPTSVAVTPSGTYILELGGLAQYFNGAVTQLGFTDPAGAAGSVGSIYSGMAYQPLPANAGAGPGWLYILNSNVGANEVFTYNITTGATAKVIDKTVTYSGIGFGVTPYSSAITSTPSRDVMVGNQTGQQLFIAPYTQVLQLYGGPMVTPKALAANPNGTLNYVDAGNSAAQMSKTLIDFGPVSGTNVNTYFNTTGAFQNFTLDAMGDYTAGEKEFTIVTNGCAGSAKNNCLMAFKATPQGAGRRLGALVTSSQIPLVATGMQSLLEDLTAPTISYGSTQHPVHLYGDTAPYTFPYTLLGGITADGLGNIYLSTNAVDGTNGMIELIPDNGSYAVQSRGTYNATALAVDGAGNVYANDPTNGISKGILTPLASVGGAETTPSNGLAIDAANGVLYASALQHGIVRIAQDAFDMFSTNQLVYFDPNLVPVGVFVDTNNVIYTFDATTKWFLKITPFGNMTHTAAIAGVTSMGGFAVTPDGTIFYVDLDTSTLHSYTLAGVDTTLTSSAATQLAVLPNGSLAGVNPANGTVDIYPFTAPVINFAGTLVGKTSSDSPKMLPFKNFGNATSIPSGLGITGGSFSATDNGCTDPVAVDATCSLTVGFKPTLNGANSSTVTINLSQSQGILPTITLTGQGTYADHLSVTEKTTGSHGPLTLVAGHSVTLAITPLNADGTPATSYTGTVHYTSSDFNATLTSDNVFDNTMTPVTNVTSNPQLRTAGIQTFTATDTTVPSLTASITINVTPDVPASIYYVSGSSQTVVVGQPYAPFVGVVFDQFTNPVPGVTVTLQSGSGCTFNGSSTATAVTDNTGTFTSPVCTASYTSGPFNVGVAVGTATPFFFTAETKPFSGGITSGGISFLGALRINPAPALTNPLSLTVDNKGYSYVFDSGSNSLIGIAATGVATTWLSGSDLGLGTAGPGQITVDSTGKLYIPDPSHNRVLLGATDRTVSTLTMTGAVTPVSVITTGGTTYVLEQSAGLFTLAANGTLSPVAMTDPDGAAGAVYTGMVLNRQGRLFILNSAKSELFSYDTVTHATLKSFDMNTTVDSQDIVLDAFLGTIAADNEGFVYTADRTHVRILKTQPNGSATQTYTGLPSIYAKLLAVNPTGSIAFIDGNNRVLGNVSDSMVDVGTSDGRNSVNAATLYWKLPGGTVNKDYGALGNDLSNEFIRTADTCGTTVGTCTTGLYGAAAAPGQRVGFYSFSNASGRVSIPTVVTGTQSDLVYLAATPWVYGGSDPQNTFQHQATIDGMTGAIAVDGAGNVYMGAANYTDSTPRPAALLKANGNGASYSLLQTFGSVKPSLIALDGVGNLYMLDSATGDIVRATTADPTYAFSVLTPGYALSGLATDAHGYLLYASDVNGTIIRHDSTFAGSTELTLYHPAGAKPQGLSVDAANGIWTFDASLKKFVRIASDGSITVSPAVPADNVSALRVLGNGTIAYINKDTSTLHLFTAAGVDSVLGSETATQIGFTNLGDIVIANSATNTMDIYPWNEPSATFSPTTVGKDSADSPRSFLFTNIGASAATGMAIVASGQSFLNSGTDCGTTLDVSASCSLFVTFKPFYVNGANFGGFTFSFDSQVPHLSLGLQGAGLGAASLQLTTHPNPTAGQAVSEKVTAIASDNTIYTAYAGTIHYSSTDPLAILPPDHAFTAGDAGNYTAPVIFKTAGTQMLTVTETMAQGPALTPLTTSATYTVSAGPVAAITLVTGDNQSVAIGSPYAPFYVLLTDAYGNARPNAPVTFTENGGCAFTLAPTNTSTVVSDSLGLAQSDVCTATSIMLGAFTVSVSVPGFSGTTPTFHETNLRATPAILITMPATVAQGVATPVSVTESVPAGLILPTGNAYYAIDATATFSSPFVTVTNGTETITLPSSLAPGNHTLSVIYGGDGRYFSASGSQSFTVTGQHVWVLNGNNSVSQLTNSGVAVSGTVGYFGSSNGIAVDAQGNVWTGTIGGAAITRFSITGQNTATYGGGGIDNPLFLAIDGANNIWAVNAGGTLSQIANDGTTISPATGFTGGGMNVPVALSIDASGNVWVANSGDSSVTEFLGAAAPAVMPLATAAANSTQGVKP